MIKIAVSNGKTQELDQEIKQCVSQDQFINDLIFCSEFTNIQDVRA
jgi:hypothetical protein